MISCYFRKVRSCGQHLSLFCTSECPYQTNIKLHNSGFEAHGSEVLVGQDATISCVFTGLSQQLHSVTWLKTSGVDVKSLSNFEVTDGTFDLHTNSQTTELRVLGTENYVDTVYTCQYTALDWNQSNNQSIRASLSVFGKFLYCCFEDVS